FEATRAPRILDAGPHSRKGGSRGPRLAPEIRQPAPYSGADPEQPLRRPHAPSMLPLAGPTEVAPLDVLRVPRAEGVPVVEPPRSAGASRLHWGPPSRAGTLGMPRIVASPHRPGLRGARQDA